MPSRKGIVRSEIRIPSTTHRMLVAVAQKKKISLNKLVNLVLFEYLKVNALAGMLGPEEATRDFWRTIWSDCWQSIVRRDWG